MTFTATTTAGSPAVTDISSWEAQYKEQSIELQHDTGMFNLVSPDDSILVAGPARLSTALNANDMSTGFYIIGVCQSFQLQDSANIQPVKTIGTRRNLFTKTSTPVTASMARMMFYGKNLARALYASIASGDIMSEQNPINNKYAQGAAYTDSNFLTNLEEDLYRTAFGLGIIYHTPSTAAGATTNAGVAVGAEYLECCYLQSRAVSLQSGQTTVMEQVQLIADRVVPWDAYKQV